MKKRLYGLVMAAGLMAAGLMLAGLMLAGSPAHADFINGKQLRLYCLSQNPSDDAICVVYITGAVDAFTTVDLIVEKTEGTARRFCIPDGVGPDQLRDVMLAWLERPESNLDFAATLLVLGALEDSYGCS